MSKKLIALFLSLSMVMALTACGSSSQNVESSSADEASTDAVVESEEPEGGEASFADVAGTYTYDEVVEALGFTVVWTLELAEDGTFSLTEGNDLVGDTVYTGEYTVAAAEDGYQVSTGALTSEDGSVPEATFFNEDTTAEWMIASDGTLTPVGAESSADGAIDAGEETAESSSNADYANVSYASNSDSQVLDIYLPEGEGSYPVIVLVHGGGFMFGDQTMDIIQPVIEAGVANGYAVVSVDYRKSSEAQFPAALADVKAAVRYVRANAEEYGFDTDSIVIWGESAGAYLSSMTALTANVEDLNGDVTDNLDYSSDVVALVDFYGPIEFYTMDDEYAEMGIESSFGTDDSFESQFLGQNLSEDETFTYTTYWETYIDQFTNTDLIAWIQAGDSDTSVPYTQSANFAERLTSVLGEEQVQFGLIEGAEHEDDLFYTEENLADVFAFLSKVIS